MYAVVEIGGHQYRVSEGDVLFVDKQSDETDQELTFERVMLINDEGNVTVGKPTVEGASVEATLLDNVKSDKIIVFKKKRRKGYRVKRGHRQPKSHIKTSSIAVSGTNGQAEETATVSTDLSAKEAMQHIEDTDIEDLQGFVPGDEDRVTVLDAWNTKQEG